MWSLYQIINGKVNLFDCREKIPLEMQEECDTIYAAVLHNTMQGNAAKRQLKEADTPFMTIIHWPQRQVKSGK